MCCCFFEARVEEQDTLLAPSIDSTQPSFSDSLSYKKVSSAAWSLAPVLSSGQSDTDLPADLSAIDEGIGYRANQPVGSGSVLVLG